MKSKTSNPSQTLVSIVGPVDGTGRFFQREDLMARAKTDPAYKVFCISPGSPPYLTELSGKIVVPSDLSIGKFLSLIDAEYLITAFTCGGLGAGLHALSGRVRRGFFEPGKEFEASDKSYTIPSGNIVSKNGRYLHKLDFCNKTMTEYCSFYGPDFVIGARLLDDERVTRMIQRLRADFQYAPHEIWKERGIPFNPFRQES